LRHLAVRGAGATVFSQCVMQAIQIIATVLLARLLTPADFGVVAMVTTFSLLFSNFGLNGFTEAVLQREEIDHFLISNLFWVNLGAGLLLTVGFAAAGSLVAQFYSNPHVTPVAMVMSLTIFITSSSVLHLALLKRAMSFSVVACNDIIARGVSVLASILLAWAGWGYWALVAGAVAQSLSTSIGAFILCRWVPSIPARATGTGSMVKFAMHVFGRFSVNYGARNMDNALVGWRFNAEALGFYKKAYDLFAQAGGLLVSSLTAVAVSALSRVSQDPTKYKRYLLRALALTAFVGMGLGINLTLVGNDVIRLLLGPGWDQAGRIFTFFGPGIGIMLLYGTHSWIHLSLGKPDRWFLWGIVEFAFTGLLFLLALSWGPVGIAVAWTASFWILTIPALWYAGNPIDLGIGPVLAAVWKYIVASLLAGWACRAILGLFPSFVGLTGVVGSITRMATTSLLFEALYLTAVILFHQGCAPLYQLARLLPEMGLWGTFSRPSASLSRTDCTIQKLYGQTAVTGIGPRDFGT
jgi:O-antigen/teichoic acid export membrane protein